MPPTCRALLERRSADNNGVMPTSRKSVPGGMALCLRAVSRAADNNVPGVTGLLFRHGPNALESAERLRFAAVFPTQNAITRRPKMHHRTMTNTNVA